MTPTDLTNLYSMLRRRVCIHVPGACAELSLPLSSSFEGELSFYRLVNWSYVLFNEAARVVLPFLTSLPPLRSPGTVKKDIDFLRTYVAHNLDVTVRRDMKTTAAVHRWFKAACGHGHPRETEHFVAACSFLCKDVQKSLIGAIDACDALDDEVDGPGLISDLKHRVDISWAANRFDPIVSECARFIGNPGLDLVQLRSKRLAIWRRVLVAADESDRERALRLRIEADLLTEVAEALPLTAKEAASRLCLSGTEAVVAGLIILRQARIVGGLSVPEIIELVASDSTNIQNG